MGIPDNHDLPVLDRDTLLDQVGGDAELMLSLVEMFAGDSAATVDAIRAGVSKRDARSIEQGAHRLKGSLGTLAAPAAYDAAFALEMIGRSGDLDNAAAAWSRLERELERLQPELERLAAEG